MGKPENTQTVQDAAQLVVGGVGIGVGFMENVIHWAQVVSILGGAIIVLVTLGGMIWKGLKCLKK